MEKKITFRESRLRLSPTDRINRMRQCVIEAKPILCSDRALLVTEAYQETESLPAPLRRAKAFQKIMENMVIHIWDDELIVASHGSNGRRSAPVFPEFAVSWLEEELNSTLESREQDTFVVPPQVKLDLKGIFPYWRGKTVYDFYRSALPENAKRARDAYMFSRDLFERNGYGHTAYDLPKLLKKGVKGIRQECAANLKTLDLTLPEDLEKKLFYQGLIICCDAVATLAGRYSKLAISMAEEEKNPQRKKELLKIADVCAWVPENPARDIWDCIQITAFLQVILQTETSGDSVSPGRLDQYFIEYYRNDIKKGTYTVEQVQELLDCLWIKLNEIVKVQDSESIHIHPGFPMTPNLTIGGQTPEGEDGVNELSYLMLNSQEHIRLTNPQFTVRIFEGTPEEFKLRVAEVIQLGTGMPALFGDRTCIAAIQRHFPDMPIERARDYRIVGCVELTPRGFQGRVNGGQLNMARVVDLALNDGIDRLTGEQIGLKTGSPAELTTFERVWDALRAQLDYFLRLQVINAAVVDMTQRQHTPHLFLSGLVEGCVEHGKDMTWGGSLWGATPILHVGEATAANSLAAVKKLVFDEGRITLEELKEAQDSNFTGDRGSEIRKLLLAAPKYGNDDDYADGMMKRMTDLFFHQIKKYKDVDGRPYTSMILTLGGTIPHGWKTGATADGRLSGTPVSDSMSPSNGTDTEGPTAVLLSAGKINQSCALEGNVLNLKFSRAMFGEGDFMKKFVDLYSTYLIDLGGQEVQVNVVSSADLRDAQLHPEKYQDLIIRVAGYSARFVELSRELQNDIITRTEIEAL